VEEKQRDFIVKFGQVVRKHRQIKGLSQEELADLAALHRTYISEIERGLKAVSLASLLRIAQALNVPAHMLMREAEQSAKNLE